MGPTKPPYKGAGTGQWLTKALFHETAMTYPVDLRQYPLGKEPFSLSTEYPGQICVRKTFVDLGDPTGYQWALTYLGDYAHWKKLVQCTWFKKELAEWINELETKTRSEAILRLREIGASGSPQAAGVNRYLATLDYKKNPRGRPSKSEIDAETKRIIEATKEEEDDYERIRVVK